MTFGRRLLAYAATIIVVPWVALTIWEQFPDNQCGGASIGVRARAEKRRARTDR